MERFYTTVKQAKKLMELGIDPKTCDMTYTQIAHREGEKVVQEFEASLGQNVAISHSLFSFRYGYTIPCWSVGALFCMMPNYIEYNGEYCFIKTARTRKGFLVECSNNRGYIAFCKDYKTLIDGLYQLLCWLVKNDYLKP